VHIEQCEGSPNRGTVANPTVRSYKSRPSEIEENHGLLAPQHSSQGAVDFYSAVVANESLLAEPVHE
jgi:hypothetical protein